MSTTAPAQAAPQRGNGTHKYPAAIIPEPFVILGRRLLPFTLDHYDLMRRFECAFVAEEKGYANYNDLILGVLICSMEPADFLRYIESSNAGKEIKAWGKSVGMWDFKEKAKLFQQYLKQGWEEPPHVAKGGASRGGDWSQNVRVTLMARMNYTVDSFSKVPLSKVLSDYYKLAESEGVIQLLTDEDLEAMKPNDEAFAQLQKILSAHGRS